MPEKPKKGHTTGIGINNVIQRLRLYYKKDDIINISSEKGKGTKIVIRIPAQEGRACISL
jgi:sensor histidine kinase YesM